MLSRLPLVMALMTVVAATGPRLAGAQADDQTIERATWLLQKATLIHRDGFQNILLRALRQLRDPALEPLFSQLVQNPHPSMRIHGVLGLAEISPNRRIDLALIADVKSQATQAQMVSAAMDADLLSHDDALQLINWPGLDPAVKVIVASTLVAAAVPFDDSVLDEAMTSDNPALSGLASLLRLQLGKPNARQALDRISELDAPKREAVLIMLLETAMRYEFDRVAEWAGDLMEDPQLQEPVELRALRAALMFNAPRAVNIWMQRFDSQTNVAHRIRLAAMALDIADRLDPRVFLPMADDDQPLIQQIGRTGRAIATRADATDLIAGLIDQNNVLLSRWALEWSKRQADAVARPVLAKLLEAAADPEPRFRAQRLEMAVMAAQQLAGQSEASVKAIRDRLVDSPELVQEAILMGLIRAEGPVGVMVLQPAEQRLTSRTAQAMALLIRAKHGRPLSDAEIERLSLIVRGGTQLEQPLRIQAAWAYLKLTRQNQIALAAVLGGQPTR